VNCNLCDGNRYEFFTSVGGYKFVRCEECGLVYLNPRPAQQKTREEYSGDYQIKRLLEQEPRTKEEIEEEISKNIGRVEEVVKRFGNKGKLLDIGCGAGFFIACLKRYGWDVMGVEVSEWAAKFAKEKLKLKVLLGSFEDVEIGDLFDLITMYHILEHLPNPLKSLKQVSRLLAADGVLIIKGPNLGGFDRIWHGKNWRGYSDRTHLYHFTPKTYRMILEKAGFHAQWIAFQYWDPIAHLMETRLGDGIRADHPSHAIEQLHQGRRYNGPLFKGISAIMLAAARLLNLKGRDLTVYAKKRKNP